MNKPTKPTKQFSVTFTMSVEDSPGLTVEVIQEQFMESLVAFASETIEVSRPTSAGWDYLGISDVAIVSVELVK